MLKTPILFAISALLFASSSLAEPSPTEPSLANHKWNKANDPRNLNGSYLTQFSKLSALTEGDATVDSSGNPTGKGWSDSYWPKNRGYIADRWQDPGAKFKFKSYAIPTGGARAIQNMSVSELNLLSPAEKFDIIRARYDFPLIRKLIKDTEPKDKDWWKGLCDGWTTASLNIPEPKPITFKNKDGIEVPLTSSDIKGLLSFYYARRHDGYSYYVGKSCRANKKLMLGVDGSCRDVNAGAFHVILVNEIGMKKKGFAMDLDGGLQVWNHPILKYKTEYTPLSRKPSRSSEGEFREVAVKTTITYANELYQLQEGQQENDETATPSAEPVLETNRQSFKTKTYEYILQLVNDQVVGGEWTGGDDSPDLIWKLDFQLPGMGSDEKGNADDWSLLKKIVQQATRTE